MVGVLPPLCSSWTISVIELYAALNMTPDIDYYPRYGLGPFRLGFNFGNQSCGRPVFQGSAILTPQLCQNAFAQELWIAACEVLLATQCLGIRVPIFQERSIVPICGRPYLSRGRADLALQTMAESSLLAFIGVHKGGSSARLLGEASFLQAGYPRC